MKRLLLLLLCTSYLCGCVKAPSKVFETKHNWSEPADPNEIDSSSWVAIEEPIVSFGSVDIRYPRSYPLTSEVTKEHSVTGWRGERVHAQVVISTPSPIEDLWCKVGDFKGANGGKLKGIGEARFVKYLLTDTPYETRVCRTPPQESVHLQPDLLDEAPYLDIEANTSRPIWITVEIPRDAKAGEYSSTIELRGEGFKESLSLNLNIADRTLPPASEWVFHLDLWQHPCAVARVEGVEPWSDDHFELMAPIMERLAKAGQKVITANVNKDPWNQQTYDAYEDMVEWRLLPDGSWEYDFTIFDRWVEFMMDLGVTKMINCYSLLPWSNMIHYRDMSTGEYVDVQTDPTTPIFEQMWGPFLSAFEQHLNQKGWTEITNIAMDERSPEAMAEAVKVKNKYAPSLGIALADNHSIFKKYPDIKDMCTGIFFPIEHEDILSRRARGLITTYYVCCSSYFPNTYTSSAPAEAVYLGWYSAAYDYDGFLRWAYNAWPEDPIRDSRFVTWTGGDTYIIYPQNFSSIRFERLLEGVQDWEKLRIIRDEYRDRPEELTKLDDLLLNFRTEKPFEGWNELLNEAKGQLNKM